MSTEDQPCYKTFSYRVKDATSGKGLVALGNHVNKVWNYCNEVSGKSAPSAATAGSPRSSSGN
jgi:putative transposase